MPFTLYCINGYQHLRLLVVLPGQPLGCLTHGIAGVCYCRDVQAVRTPLYCTASTVVYAGEEVWKGLQPARPGVHIVDAIGGVLQQGSNLLLHSMLFAEWP